ncbi:MAG TPA: DUF4388 domain-containing protein [Planktothrix sp.]|jgi:diguanylate cyclase (GGDEF)-like protein
MLKKTGTAGSSKLSYQPDMPELHHMLSQAMGTRGQPVVRTWRSSNKMMFTFTLSVVCPVKGGDPNWSLINESRGNRSLVFEYPSCDVLMINNLLNSPTGALASLSRSMEKSEKRAETSQPLPIVQSLPSLSPHNPMLDQRLIEAPVSLVPTIQPAQAAVPESGDIAKTPVLQLLQMITSAKLTGKLEVRSDNSTGLVYIQDGRLVDATTSGVEGDEGIIELLTWNEGQFIFEKRVLRNSPTVSQNIDTLVAQSKLLSEHQQYLKEKGIQPNSLVQPVHKDISETELLQRLERVPLNIVELCQLFRTLDGNQTFDEIAGSNSISRIQLVHMLYHLMVNDLIRLTSKPTAKTKLKMQHKVIDTAAIQSVMLKLRRADTGMFLYPAFLYFLEQEYLRCYRARSPLSVITFEMRALAANSDRQVLPTPAVLEAALRISKLKRHVDLIAHYDAFDYAILLPNTKVSGAEIFANRVVKALTASPLSADMPEGTLSLALGCASIPEDFIELSALLGAADLAMTQARDSKKPLIMYRDIKHMVS